MRDLHDGGFLKTQRNAVCVGGTGTSQGTMGPTSLSGSAADSSDTSALHADTYYFRVSFDSADDGQWNDTSTCEDFTINQATPTVTTALLDASDSDVKMVDAPGSKSPPACGWSVG